MMIFLLLLPPPPPTPEKEYVNSFHSNHVIPYLPNETETPIPL